MADETPVFKFVNPPGSGAIIRNDQGDAGGGGTRDVVDFEQSGTEVFSVDSNGLPDPGGGDPKRAVICCIGLSERKIEVNSFSVLEKRCEGLDCRESLQVTEEEYKKYYVGLTECKIQTQINTLKMQIGYILVLPLYFLFLVVLFVFVYFIQNKANIIFNIAAMIVVHLYNCYAI